MKNELKKVSASISALKIALAASFALTASAAMAEDVKLGLLIGFTGAIESMAPGMANSTEMAVAEVNAAGGIIDGKTLQVVRGDSTCTDAAAAVAAATRLVTSDKVSGIVGADCSGVSAAVLQSVARPNGMLMISPASTSPSLSSAEDDGLFFRTVPSDSRQGEVMAKVIWDRGFKDVAVTYTNTDWGKGLTESFEAAYKKLGGNVTANVPHEDGKADYSAEVGTLAASNSKLLVVIGFVDQGGKGVIRAAVDAGAFEQFFLPSGMYGQSLIDTMGSALDGSFGDIEGTDSAGAKDILRMAKEAGFDGSTPYVGESYDAAALIMLAMQAAKSTDPTVYKSKIFDVANAPGEEIFPGNLAKGLKLLAEGKDINYVGATNVEMIGAGEATGSYRIYTIKNGAPVTDGYE